MSNLVIIFALFFFNFKNITANPLENNKYTAIEINQEYCENIGVKWRKFSNGCANYCSKYETELVMCTMALTWSCDCGANKCFDNNTKLCRNIKK